MRIRIITFLNSQCGFEDDVGLRFERCDFRPGNIHEFDWVILASPVRGSLKIAIKLPS